MSHTDNSCLMMKQNSGSLQPHAADEDAVKWLLTLPRDAHDQTTLYS